MKTTAAILFFDAAHRAGAEALAAELPGAYRRVSRRDELEVTLAGGAEVSAAPTTDVVVLAAPEEHLTGTTYRLLDSLQEQGRPVLALADDFSRAVAHFGSEDVLIVRLGESAEEIALRIHTLAARQPAFARLHQDLSTAKRFSGGLWSEVSRMQDDLQLAAIVQREFLPRRLPEPGAVRFGVFFRPAGFVSGDIYDIMALDEHRVGFFLADAVGHGVPAALMTMAIVRSLQVCESTPRGFEPMEPAEVLRRLNADMLAHQGTSSRFATAVYGVIDSRSGRGVLAGAGHPHPLLLRTGREPQALSTTGSLLGVFEDAEFDQVEFMLRPGERLMIYSDGFETAFPDSGGDAHDRRLPTPTYLERFAEIAATAETVSGVSESIAVEIDRQIGSLHQLDDLTALCIGLETSAVDEAAGCAEPVGAGVQD